MQNKKFDEYGHRIRNIEEILTIKENLKSYILTKDMQIILLSSAPLDKIVAPSDVNISQSEI